MIVEKSNEGVRVESWEKERMVERDLRREYGLRERMREREEVKEIEQRGRNPGRPER